jgi:hypothetical protein
MVLPEDMISIGGQHALQDMVELKMYLLVQTQQTPWPMLPRGSKKLPGAREPHSTLVESSAVQELLDQRFIEATSRQTFVVSKSGYQFYQKGMKSSSIPTTCVTH